MNKLVLAGLMMMAAAQAGAVDWTGRTGAGGVIAFNRFSLNDRMVDFISNGVSVTHGFNSKLRLGADAGVFVAHTTGDDSKGGGTSTGFMIGPSAAYDIVSKETGSFYLQTRPLNFLQVDEGPGGEAAWELSLLTAGVGLEALVSKDFSIAMEGDAFRLGLVHFVKTRMNIGALGFPAARIALRMYF